jgi:hypothetical protein
LGNDFVFDNSAISSILAVTLLKGVRDWIMGKNYIGPPEQKA